MQIKIVPTGYLLDDIGPASPKIVRATFDLYLFKDDSVRLYVNSSQSSKLIFSSFNNKFLDSFVQTISEPIKYLLIPGFLTSNVGSGFRESGTYTDTGVETGAAYFYRIITTNDSGVTGSTITRGTVGEGYQAPHAISGLTVSSAGAGSGQLNLNWTSPGYTGIGYTIQIYSGSGSAPAFALHTELTGSDAQGGLYSHTALTSGVTYSYKLRAKDSSTTSGPYTNIVSGAAE